MAVELFDSGYTRWGSVPDYVSCQVTWEWLGVGQGQLAVGEDDPAAEVLMQSLHAPVFVRAVVGGRRWTGRVVTPALDFDGPPGSGTVTATLVDDWAWLLHMLASQNGANPALSGMPQFDTQTGPAATVAAYYVNAAAARLAVPVVAVVPVGDQSQAITVNARMDPLADLLSDQLKGAGITMPAQVWLPGDPQPLNLHLSRPTVVFTPQQVQPKPWLRWNRESGGIIKGTFSGNAATAYRAPVGLDGQDAARVYDQVINTDLQAQLGAYAFPETYFDESSTALGADSQAKGLTDLAGLAPTASAAVTVLDGEPWTFGKDYTEADLATLEVFGVASQQRITRVTASDDRADGLTFTPVIGDTSVAATSDELVIKAIADIAQQLRAVKARR